MTASGDNCFYASAVDSEDGNALIFISYELMLPFLEAGTIFIDGTFRVVPSIFYQLVTIHFLAFDKVTFKISVNLGIRKLTCFYS